MDLTDAAERDRLRARLAEPYAGRPVVLGPGVLAALTARVHRYRALGCPVLVLATADGAGALPEPNACTVLPVAMPPTASTTDEVRVLDRVVRTLPPDTVAAIEAFDPEGRGVVVTPPFVGSAPVLGRPVRGGRPAAFAVLEDKTRADAVWDAAGVARAPARVVDTDRTALAAASDELAVPGLGTVWSGDASGGVNGGGNYVRWVVDDADRAAAFAFFAPRCDRVRVQPFLDGVPCSIHGVVLPDGTAVFRPVELAVLRDRARRRFVDGGLSTWWDPPPADRHEMRAAARRVGDHLAAEHGYRGAFGIDGVLTADGFRPTELNTRASAGFTAVASVDPALLELVQHALLAGHDPGVRAADLEGLVTLMDAERHGRPSAVGQGVSLGRGPGTGSAGAVSTPVVLVDGVLRRDDTADTADTAAGSLLVAGDTPVGLFATITPCALLGPGDRLAPLDVALFAHLDREHGTGFGVLEAAPDLRT